MGAGSQVRSHCGNSDLFTSALNPNLTFHFDSVWFQSQLQKGQPCYKIATCIFFFSFSVIAFGQVLYFERRVKRITPIQILLEFFSQRTSDVLVRPWLRCRAKKTAPRVEPTSLWVKLWKVWLTESLSVLRAYTNSEKNSQLSRVSLEIKHTLAT